MNCSLPCEVKVFTPKYTNEFLKCLKKDKKRNLTMDLLQEVMNILISGKPLPQKYRDHALTGKYKGYRECHVKPDWLLVYYKTEDTIVFAKTGSHTDLFD